MSADDARKLFVGGLSDSITEEALRDLFERSGQTVVDVHVPRDRDSGRPRGFAFVTFSNPDAAEVARTALDGQIHDGRSMSVRRFSQEGPRRSPAERAPRSDDCTVFVGKLPYDTSPAELEALFAEYEVSPVVRISLPVGPDGRPRGFGFVTLETPEAASAAVQLLSNAQLRGRTLAVTPAQPRGKGPGPLREGGPSREGGEPRARLEGSRMGPRLGSGGVRGPRGGYDVAPPSERDDFGRMEAMSPPPDETEFGRREDKKRKKDKKKRTSERASRRERGGAGTWHRWEMDDE